LTQVAKGKGCREVIMSIGFNPTGDCLVATCVKSVVFFTWENGAVKSTKGTGWGSTPLIQFSVRPIFRALYLLEILEEI